MFLLYSKSGLYKQKLPIILYTTFIKGNLSGISLKIFFIRFIIFLQSFDIVSIIVKFSSMLSILLILFILLPKLIFCFFLFKLLYLSCSFVTN